MLFPMTASECPYMLTTSSGEFKKNVQNVFKTGIPSTPVYNLRHSA